MQRARNTLGYLAEHCGYRLIGEKNALSDFIQDAVLVRGKSAACAFPLAKTSGFLHKRKCNQSIRFVPYDLLAGCLRIVKLKKIFLQTCTIIDYDV